MPRIEPLITVRADAIGVTIESNVFSSLPTWSKSATWNSQAIMNRASPVLTYDSSTSMTLSFGIKLFAIDRAKGSQIEVVDIVKSARALVTPVTPGIRPPALCKITYKAMDLYDWECFCTEVSGATPDNIWDVNKNPMTAELTFSFIEVDRKNLGAATYVQGGGRMKTLFSPDLVMGKGGSTLIGGASMFSEEVREGNPNYNEYLRNTGMF